MKALRCQGDEFGHHFRQKTEMIKMIDHIVGQGRGSLTGPNIPGSIIHHNDTNMTRVCLVNLVCHGRGKLAKWGGGKCVLYLYFLQRRWLKNKLTS